MTTGSKLFNTFVLCVLFFIVFFFVFAATTSVLGPTADGGEDSAGWFNSGATACSGADCYLEVDETSGGTCTSSDGDTSYIYNAGDGVSQSFDIDESSIPDGAAISQIDITTCYDTEGVQVGGTFQTRYCFDGSCTSSGMDLIAGSSYSEATQSFSVSHEKVSGSDIEIGVISTHATKEVRVSQLYAVITYTIGDATAPSDISDLALSGETETSIDLDWTAPGDDAGSGTATTYDIRYSTSLISDANWAAATQATGEPSPSVAGSPESLTVSGLTSGTTYYFAIKTSDEVPNESGLSNIPNTSTPADTTAPSDISDVDTSGVGQTSVNLSWTAPGDDAGSGTATSYDVRYAVININAGNWNTATEVSGEPTPSVAGSSESLNVIGLSAATLYYFAIKTSDEVPNDSGISNIFSTTTTLTGDTTAPSDVSDLASSGATSSSIDLDWTAPGDDASSGTAISYDVRYSTAVINDGNWPSAIQVSGESMPSVAGTSESMTVSGLTSGTTYYFAMKTSDEVPNESTLSNVPSLSTTGGGSVSIPSGAGAVAPSTISFSGRAYPGSSIEVLTRSALDVFINVPLERSSVDENGVFVAQTLGLLSGPYFVGLQISDKDGNKTDLISFDVNLLEENLVVGDLVIPPTVHIETQEVKVGEDVHISGYGIPETTLELNIDDEIVGEYELGSDGSYDVMYNVADLSADTHYVRARITDSVNDAHSAFSSPRAFKITTLSFPEADLNKDDKVNITDWSIFLSKWGSEGDKSSIDFNKDGKINIIDLSIFLRAIIL